MLDLCSAVADLRFLPWCAPLSKTIMVQPSKAKPVFASAILLLLFCAAASYLSFFYFRAGERWVSHTQEVRASVGDVGAALDTAARARMIYLLNGDDSYLAAYQNAVALVNKQITSLSELTRDNSTQQENVADLQGITQSRLQNWQEAIAARQRGEAVDVARVLPQNLDWGIKNAAILDEIRTEEVRQLQQRTKIAHRRFVFTSAAIAISFALALIQLLYYYRLLNKELLLRQASEQKANQAYILEVDLRQKEQKAQRDLQHTNAELSKEIAERKSAESRLAFSERSLRNLSRHLLRSQDEERKRIGRELHDSLGQSLAVLKMNLDTLDMEMAAQKTDGAASNMLKQCLTLADDILREVRTISYLLYPPMLEEMGLKSAIAWYLDGFSKRSNIQARLEAEPDFGRLPAEAELALFRILQESLTNIHRHSGSPTADIRLYSENGLALMEIRDQGKGIPPTLLEQSGADWMGSLGVGLRGMNERMRQLGGKLEVASSERGTAVVASIPVESAATRMDLSA
jgi:signal transduction histidine kinase